MIYRINTQNDKKNMIHLNHIFTKVNNMLPFHLQCIVFSFASIGTKIRLTNVNKMFVYELYTIFIDKCRDIQNQISQIRNHFEIKFDILCFKNE